MRISDWSSDVCSSDLFRSQHIKPVEQDREYPGRVMIAQCGAYRCPRPLEPVSPVGIAGRTIVMLPKGMEDIAVCEQHPDFLREALPDHVVDAMFAIKAHKGCEEGLEQSPLALGDSNHP